MKVNPRRHSVNNHTSHKRLKLNPSNGSFKNLGNVSSDNSNDENTSFSAAIARRKARAVKSEKRHSIKLNLEENNFIITKRNYMSLESDELEDRNIVGTRKTLAIKMQAHITNIAIISLIILYCFLTFIFTSIPDNKSNDGSGVKAVYHTFECLIILCFIVEIVLSKYAFKELYYRNKYNAANSILMGFIILFLFIDIVTDNYTASILTRSRGVMRLFHLPILFDNMKSHLKLQRNASYKDVIDQIDEEKPTAERVIEILLELTDKLDDTKLSNDINFCVKHIASGTLYENKTKDVQRDEVKQVRRRRGAILQMEENAWIRSCSNIFRIKRDSNDTGTIIMTATDHRSLESLLDFPNGIAKTIENLDSKDFNLFDFKEECNDRELTVLTSLLLHKHSLYSGLKIQINKFMVFMDKVSSGYNTHVKYHNKSHAADVCQTMYYFVMNSNWLSVAKMDNIDICSMVIATAVHDYEHPGYNNIFLIKTRDTLAVRYNDISVLENHHVAASFGLLKIENYNIFDKLNNEDQTEIRKRMIHMVLSTDMSKHFSDLGTFKQRLTSENFQPDDKDKLLCMGVGVHLADISNPTKHWDLTLKWTELLFEEFFKQGDKERELKLQVSDLMDRSTTNIAKAQLGFIDVIVMPAYESFGKFCKCVSKNIKQMKKNRETWASLIDEYNLRMEEGRKMVEMNNEIIEEAKSESEEDSCVSSSDSSLSEIEEEQKSTTPAINNSSTQFRNSPSREQKENTESKISGRCKTASNKKSNWSSSQNDSILDF